MVLGSGEVRWASVSCQICVHSCWLPSRTRSEPPRGPKFARKRWRRARTRRGTAPPCASLLQGCGQGSVYLAPWASVSQDYHGISFLCIKSFFILLNVSHETFPQDSGKYSKFDSGQNCGNVVRTVQHLESFVFSLGCYVEPRVRTRPPKYLALIGKSTISLSGLSYEHC